MPSQSLWRQRKWLASSHSFFPRVTEETYSLLARDKNHGSLLHGGIVSGMDRPQPVLSLAGKARQIVFLHWDLQDV